jgi:hypothetical protein
MPSERQLNRETRGTREKGFEQLRNEGTKLNRKTSPRKSESKNGNLTPGHKAANGEGIDRGWRGWGIFESA